MAEISIGKADLAEGGLRCASAGGKEFAVAKIKGKYLCIDNACTHAGYALCQGAIGELNGFSVTCPLHNSAFDMRDGAVLREPAARPVRRYEVRERDGELFISL